jgi:sporulation protein YlmC with PRC-barrel domain
VDYGDPTSYMALEPGTAVISSDGERVGKVEHVLADADSDIFDGLVIDVESGPGGLHFVDSEQVGELFERGCVLKVRAAEVKELPKPAPSPAVMEHHGVEDSEGSLEAKLHRAWNRITGNY